MNTTPSSQDNRDGDNLPKNVIQEMSHSPSAEIPISQPEVWSSGLALFTRPRLSDSAPVRGRNGPFNVGNTPVMRSTGHTAQMSGMSVGSSYYDRIETSAPPNRDLGCGTSIPSFHQSWSSPSFPSIHQAQSVISMQSYDPAKLSPHASSFHGFQHSMSIPSSYPNQALAFMQNPYYYHLQPSVGTPNSIQGGHTSGSTCMYESAPTVGISGRAHYNLPPTISDMYRASYDQVRPSFITPGAYGYGHRMGISTSYLNQPTVFMQDPYHTLVQPVHTIESPFECEECDLQFTREDALRTHYNRFHLNMTRFKCEVCARSFYFKYELDRHNCSMT